MYTLYGKALQYLSILLACVRISEQFKVRLDKVMALKENLNT